MLLVTDKEISDKSDLQQMTGPPLLAMHHGKTTGIFACSGHAIEARIVCSGSPGHYV